MAELKWTPLKVDLTLNNRCEGRKCCWIKEGVGSVDRVFAALVKEQLLKDGLKKSSITLRVLF